MILTRFSVFGWRIDCCTFTDGETSVGQAPLPVEISTDSTVITSIADSALIIFSHRK